MGEKLPSAIEEYLNEKSETNLAEAHLARVFIVAYLEGAGQERSGKHQNLTDDEVAVLGLEKAKEFINIMKTRGQI